MNAEPEPELSDSALLARYAESGDSAAFERLYKRHQRLVFAASRAVLGNDDSAEDAVGATFVLLSKHAENLSRRPTLEGWLYQTATLVAKSLKRQEEAQLRKLYRYGAAIKEDDMARSIDQPDVASYVNALPASARKAVFLRFFGGLSYAELGRSLNCSEDAARQRIQRSLEAVAKMASSSGLLMTTDEIEVALRSGPTKTSAHWMSSQGAKLADTFERSVRLSRIRLAAIGLGAFVIAVPAFNTLALARTIKSVKPRASLVANTNTPGAVPPERSQVPTLDHPFTLVYQEIARSAGLPDEHNQLTLSYNGTTLLTKRALNRTRQAEAIGLINGDKIALFLYGVWFPGLPSDTGKWVEAMEDDMDTIDPDKDAWIHEAKHSQAPPLTRFTLVTNIPTVGVSLPDPLFAISLDGSYSWFMGDPAETVRDSKGHLTHFGAYDTTYDLSDYRTEGNVDVAGRVVVRRSQGDFGGPNEYILKSASNSPPPAAEFRPETYRKGDLLATQMASNPFGGSSRLYIRPDTPEQIKAQIKAKFGIPNP